MEFIFINYTTYHSRDMGFCHKTFSRVSYYQEFESEIQIPVRSTVILIEKVKICQTKYHLLFGYHVSTALPQKFSITIDYKKKKFSGNIPFLKKIDIFGKKRIQLVAIRMVLPHQINLSPVLYIILSDVKCYAYLVIF